MKILFVVNEIPFPPDNGVKIVSHHAIRLMYEVGHDLALAVLTDETVDNEKRFQKVAAFCKDGMAWWVQLPKRNRLVVLISSLIYKRLFFVERYRWSLFKQKLIGLIEKFKPDVIHYDLIPMTQYHDVAPLGAKIIASINDSYALTLKNYLDARNYTGFERLYRWIQYRQVCRYEADVYSQFDVTHVMARADEDYLHLLNPNINIRVIPNGVENSLLEIADQTIGKIDILFIERLVAHNLPRLELFIKHGWPIVHRNFPNVKLHIVGEIGPDGQRLRSKLGPMENVIFKGYVARLKDAYCECGISIVPENKNCGIINKVIEAMASGLVVVGFKNAFKGISQAEDGVHFLVAEDYVDMGQSIVDIIRDGPRRKAIQINAHQMAAKHYSWHSRIALYEDMYQVSAEKRRM